MSAVDCLHSKDRHESMERSLHFAMFHLMPHVQQAEPSVRRQLVLDALTAGGLHAALEMIKEMDDGMFHDLVEDAEYAKEVFQNWDMKDVHNAASLTRVPSIFCGWAKHTLFGETLPRFSLRESTELHRILFQLVCLWPTNSGERVPDAGVSKTPLMLLLRWLFTSHTRLMKPEQEEFLEVRQRIVHPSKQKVEYVASLEATLAQTRSAWSLTAAPSIAIVPRHEDLEVPKSGRMPTASVRCWAHRAPEQLQAKINSAEHVKGFTAAHLYNQCDMGDGSRSVATIQLISHGTRDHRVVEQLCHWMRAVTGLPLGFTDRHCAKAMRSAFEDVDNHRYLACRASLGQLEKLADYWYMAVLTRLMTRPAVDDTFYNANGLGSGCFKEDLAKCLVDVWDGVISDSRRSEEMSALFRRAHRIPARATAANVGDVARLLYGILRSGVANCNAALLELCIETVWCADKETREQGARDSVLELMETSHRVVEGKKPQPSLLCWCVSKCPVAFVELLGLGFFDKDARAQALCKAMDLEVDELVTVLVESLGPGELPTALPRYTKECWAEGEGVARRPFLAWTMENAPRYLPALLDRADQPREVYQALLHMCDPNKADTIPVAEWLMLPPVSLPPLEDRPWLVWLNQRLYAPSGAGFQRVQADHPDLDGSQHEAKLGVAPAAKRGRTH
tara:strand:+ start:2507 stop:4540 length:2034 start_codon:yes stop_codon:yes gene_type:complete